MFGIIFLLVIGVVGGRLLFQGEDEGPSKPIAVLRTSDYHSLVFSPDDQRVVFFGHHNGILRSDDGGKTWNGLVERRNFDAMALAINPKDSRLIYLAGHDIFQISPDGGITWRPMEHNLPGTDIHAFTISPQDPQRLFAFVVGYGLFRSSDGGRTWARLGTQLPTDVIAIATSGGNPETLYAVSMRAGVLRSTDVGQNWAPAGTGLGSTGMATIVVDPEAPNTVYAGGETGLYHSTDDGNSWTRLSFPGSNVAVLAISLAQPGLLMAISVVEDEGLVYRSEDGGMTWGR